MGLFGKMFEKKICSVCSGEIGLLGNRKLDDGNLCKKCAAKLSPWFTGRRRSTVADIKEQLEYREKNRDALAEFNPTLTLGRVMKVIIDEDAGKFVVTRASRLTEENPDVIAFSQVTGVDIDIDEDRIEVMKEKSDGTEVSYNPPKFTFTYGIKIIIHVNHPYFDTMDFDLTDSDIEINPDHPLPISSKPDPKECLEYRENLKIAKKIRDTLTNARAQAREIPAVRTAVICRCCGATTVPDENGCCEYCGGAAE